MLDETVLALEGPLADQNIIVIAPPPGIIERDIRLCLSGRILVTTRPGFYISVATAHEFGMIKISKRMVDDPVTAAKAISRAIVKHRLWAMGHSFLLNLGDGDLLDLWAEEQGEEPRRGEGYGVIRRRRARSRS